MGMASLDQYLDAQLVRGRAHFTREEALAELRLSPLALKAAIGRMAKKQRVANLRVFSASLRSRKIVVFLCYFATVVSGSEVSSSQFLSS